MVDNGILRHCSLVAFAEVLDQLSGIECHSGTAVGLHLQKFWINLIESNVVMALESHFGRPDSVKLALERRFGRLAKPSWPWNGVLGDPWRQVGFGLTL